MALKPLFYMLAANGPWAYHVRLKSVTVSAEVETWLLDGGKKIGQDYEIISHPIDFKHSHRVGLQVVTQPILFFNDLSLASYVKLTWGGR